VSDPAPHGGLSVIVPAHNEAGVIGRLLGALTSDGESADFEVLVVCNGCTDDTVQRASGFAAPVRVLEIPEASKAAAMRRGDEEARYRARAYVDADVVIGGRELQQLHEEAREAGWLACAPRRVLLTDRSSRLVRWYYDVWNALPQVESGLFGRGVVLVTAAGRERLAALPDVIADDLVRSEAFTEGDRGIASSVEVRVEASRTLRGLARRRVRVVRGNTEADELGLRSTESRTSLRTLVGLGVDEPRLLPKLPVFLGVAVWSRIAARLAARRHDQLWERDESTR